MAEPIPFPKPVIAAEDAAPVPPAPSDTDSDGEHDKGGGPPPQGLPEGCPVTPLGISSDGTQFYLFDPSRRLQVKLGKDFSRLGILTLFNERWEVLQDYWPRLSKVTDKKTGETDYQVTGWKPERAAEEL